VLLSGCHPRPAAHCLDDPIPYLPRSRVEAMADRDRFVWRPGDVTVWKPEVLGIVDGLELGDDLDVEASSVTTSIPAWTVNDGFYWSDPDR
jgi:hypothetical protein